MPILDFLEGKLLALGLEWVVKKFNKVIDSSNALIVERVTLGGVPPEVVALFDSPLDLQTGDVYVDNSSSHYLSSRPENGWAGELRLRIELRNTSEHVVEVIGIAPNKNRLNVSQSMSAVLFQIQGNSTGNCCRLHCDLDSDQPFMQQYEQRGGLRFSIGERNMFAEDFIRIDPQVRVCVIVIFTAEKDAYEIEPTLVIRESEKVSYLDIPLERRALIYPFRAIDPDGFYRRSFSREAPYIVRDTPETIQAGTFRFVDDSHELASFWGS